MEDEFGVKIHNFDDIDHYNEPINKRQKRNGGQSGGRKNVTFHKHKNGKYINSSKSKTLKKTKKKKNSKDAYESLVKIFKELNFKM